jgi:hypothetical protein
MPDVTELGRAVKRKYPGAYNDLSDADLGRAFKAKYPGAYDDFTDIPAPAQPSPAAPGGFRAGISGFAAPVTEALSVGLQRGGAFFAENALALAETIQGMKRGDVEPLQEAMELGARGAASTSAQLGDVITGSNRAAEVPGADPQALAEAKRQQMERRTKRSEFKEGFQGVQKMRESADVRAARDPSLIGKAIRRGTEFATLAAPAVATGVATGGSVPVMTTLAALQSAGQPENLALNVALEAAPIPLGRAFSEGVDSVRRTFGKGAAQVIEAEAAPAIAPRFLREGLPPAPTVDPLPVAFSKLGTDNIEQIGAMIANANRRFGKKRTPEQIQSSMEDYKALQQLTPEEHAALGEVLPVRNYAPVKSDFAGEGAYAQDIADIPMAQADAQLRANIRGIGDFFEQEGRALQAAEDAAIMGDIGPAATSGQIVQPARVSAADLITSAPPSVRAAAAGVTGPRVGADLDALNVAAAQGAPPVPPGDVPTGFGGQAPQGQQALFDAAARSPWQDTVLAYIRANLLTNPVGRALDFGQTIINQFADAALRPVAAAVDVVVSKLTGQRSILGPNIRDTGRAFGSIRQGLRDARETLRTGRQAIDSAATDDVLYGREIRSGLGRGFDVPVNGLFRLIGAMDAPFRRFAFARNLQERARLAAINEAKRGRIPRDQTVARARELIDRDDIIAAAVRDGEKAVLSESNVISSWVAAQTRNSPTARLAVGLLQTFLRIPANAVFKAADFAGLGGVKMLYKIARGGLRKAKGQAFFRDLEEQRVFAQNVAAGSFGVAGFMLGMELEERGKLEGYFYVGRRDFPGRHVPTSIEIGGTRYDVGRLGGFIFAPLFIGATYNRLRKEDAGKANALLRSFSGLVQQAPALGYHGAPAKAGRILSADDMVGELKKEAGSTVSGLIPARGFLGATAKALDPAKKREAEGFTGPIMNAIPGLREMLPITGNEALDAAVDRNSPLLLEVQRLKIRVAELQRKKDEPEDTFKARVQQFAQNYTSYGLQLIQDSRFQAASDDVKERALKKLNEKAKGLTHKEFANPEIELAPGLILDMVEK